jgi:integrase
MPRKRAAPRLYLDPGRQQWVIRDGASFIRTGCAESDRRGAEKRLIEYLGQKHRPWRGVGENPLIADVLVAYASEHLPHTVNAKQASYSIGALGEWWVGKRLGDVTAKACRAYAEGERQSWARKNLQLLRAAIRHWHREHGPLPSIPVVILPEKEEPRDRWLTRSEAARLLREARRIPHLARFILLGLYTGSRSNVLLALQWNWLDLERGVMLRRAPGARESKQKRTPPVRLGRRILAHLRRWRRLDHTFCPYVCHYGGKRISSPRTSWPEAVKRAGLGMDVTPHVLRHTRATWLMQAGVDVWEAAGHLGMSPATLMQVYAKHSPDFQRRAAEV